MKIIENAMEGDEILFATLRGIDAAIDKLEHETTKVCWEHVFGEMSIDEAAKEAFNSWGVHAIMHAKHWSLWPSYPRGMDYARHDRYEAMAKDYARWKKGKPLSGEKWLFVWDNDSGLGMAPYRMAECRDAKEYEKVQFFRACEASITPICTFDSPSDMCIPSYWNANAKGELHLEVDMDASPLLLADDPVIGKEFHLPIKRGGALHIKVIGVEPGWPLPFGEEDDEEEDESFDSLEWECEGYIEGYTSTTPRNITFSTWDNEISLVTADVLEDEDWAAYKACELWKPFEEWIARHNAQIDAEAKDMFEKACERIALFGGDSIEDTEAVF